MRKDNLQLELLKYELKSASLMISSMAEAMPPSHWMPLKEAVELTFSTNDLGAMVHDYGVDYFCRNISGILPELNLFVGTRMWIAGKNRTPIFHSKRAMQDFVAKRNLLPIHKRSVRLSYDLARMYIPAPTETEKDA